MIISQKQPNAQDLTPIESQKMRVLLKDCASGFYQQMFFLGKDVSHTSGNQLIAYGFKKSPSTGLTGTSCYTYQSGSITIELYGACAALYTEHTKIVFLRERCQFYQWLPEHKLVAGRWSSDDIKLTSAEARFNDLVPLLQWWVQYEKWIGERFDPSYRNQCYRDWKKLKSRTPWLHPSIGPQWVADFLENQSAQVRPKKMQVLT